LLTVQEALNREDLVDSIDERAEVFFKKGSMKVLNFEIPYYSFMQQTLKGQKIYQ